MLSIGRTKPQFEQITEYKEYKSQGTISTHHRVQRVQITKVVDEDPGNGEYTFFFHTKIKKRF